MHSCVAFQFETNTQSQVSLEDSKDPMFNAGLKVHLELGSYYTHKDHEGKVLVLKGKDETMCHLSHHDPLTGAETMVSVSAEDIVAKLKVTKVKGNLLMEPSTLSQVFLNVTSDMEKKRATVYLQLLEAYQALDTDENFIKVLYQPGKAAFTMHAACDIKKNELVLLPCTDQMTKMISSEPNTKDFGKVQSKHGVMYVLPPKALKDTGGGWEGSFCPFFHCKSGSAKGNMSVTIVKHKDLQITGFWNTEALKENDEICLFEAAEEQQVASKRRKKA